MPIATVRDLDLYFELHGSGPPLLNISGSGGDLFMTAPDQNPLNNAFTGAALPLNTPGALGQLQARRGHDVVDRLGEIDVPTLVCAGIHDGIAPMHNSELLRDRIPGARLETFDGGHIFMVQDPTAYPAILNFLTEG